MRHGSTVAGERYPLPQGFTPTPFLDKPDIGTRRKSKSVQVVSPHRGTSQAQDVLKPTYNRRCNDAKCSHFHRLR